MTEYEDGLAATHPVDSPPLLSPVPFSPPVYVPPSAALATSKAMTATRKARRLEWAVAGLCGMVVTLVGMRVADRAR